MITLRTVVALLCLATLSAGRSLAFSPDIQELNHALIKAAEKGDVTAVSRLLAKGADVNAHDTNGSTPLTEAVYSGNATLVKLFLDKGALKNAGARNGETALMEACILGYEPMVDLLLAQGVAVNAQDRDGATALMHAANYGNTDCVNALLAKGADVHLKSKGGNTALMWATDTAECKAAIVKALLERGADPNERYPDGTTVLMEALNGPRGSSGEGKERTAMIEALLARGADVYAQNRAGQTVLMWAAEHGILRHVQLILRPDMNVNARDNTGQTALVYLNNAIFRDYVPIAEFLLQHGADVHGKDKSGVTPLMRAVSVDSLSLVAKMLDRGAEVNAKDEWGKTAIMYASGDNGVPIAQALLDRGADINASDKHGKTVLMYAAESGNPPLVRFLLTRGADVKARDADGRTALMWVQGDSPDQVAAIVDMLAVQGVDIQARDKNGKTALIWATDESVEHHGMNVSAIIATVQGLVAKGADINARDNEGKTALLRAASHRQPDEVIQLLLEKGADVNARDNRGLSTLMWEARWGTPRTHKYGPIKVLRDHGARVGLMEALLLGEQATAQALVNQETDANFKGPFGQTVLMAAAERGYLEVVEALLHRGAEVNAREEYQMSALLFAVGASPNGMPPERGVEAPKELKDPGRIALVKTLIAHGADVNASNKVGETPLQWAAHWGLTDIVRVLIAGGAEVKGKAGQEALRIADRGDHADIVTLLKQAGAKE